MQDAARPGDGVAEAVEPPQLAGGDADQRDEVVGLPEPVDVGLSEAEAAAQRAAPGRRIADRQGCPQLPVGGAEAVPAPVLDQLDPAGANSAQRLRDGGPGEPVAYGDRNPLGLLPSGWGK